MYTFLFWAVKFTKIPARYPASASVLDYNAARQPISEAFIWHGVTFCMKVFTVLGVCLVNAARYHHNIGVGVFIYSYTGSGMGTNTTAIPFITPPATALLTRSLYPQTAELCCFYQYS